MSIDLLTAICLREPPLSKSSALPDVSRKIVLVDAPAPTGQNLTVVNRTCPICLEKKGKALLRLVGCRHAFCRGCITLALKAKKECPCCRAKVCGELREIGKIEKQPTIDEMLFDFIPDVGPVLPFTDSAIQRPGERKYHPEVYHLREMERRARAELLRGTSAPGFMRGIIEECHYRIPRAMKLPVPIVPKW